MRRKSTSHLNVKLYFSTWDHAINSKTACRALTEHHRGSHTIENSCCVAMHHHYQQQNAHVDMKYLTWMIRRTQCMMWPHLLLLLILMMVMMVLHHSISSWFHTIRCMTILFFIPRALSHTYPRLNIRSNA